MGARVSEQERRAIAARLREIAAENEGYLGHRMGAVLTEAQRVMGTLGRRSCADVLRRHADLIDGGEL